MPTATTNVALHGDTANLFFEHSNTWKFFAESRFQINLIVSGGTCAYTGDAYEELGECVGDGYSGVDLFAQVWDAQTDRLIFETQGREMGLELPAFDGADGELREYRVRLLTKTLDLSGGCSAGDFDAELDAWPEHCFARKFVGKATMLIEEGHNPPFCAPNCRWEEALNADTCVPACYNEACWWHGDGKACALDCKTDTENFPDGCVHPVCGAVDEQTGQSDLHCAWRPGMFDADTHPYPGGGHCVPEVSTTSCTCSPGSTGDDCGNIDDEFVHTSTPSAAPTPELAPSVSPAPTAKPTAGPTSAPTPKPTPAPTLAPTLVTADSGGSSCVDSPSWYKGNKPALGCAWVGKKVTRRCSRKSQDGTRATEGCPATCGACSGGASSPTPAPSVCADSPSWHKKNKPEKDCAWVAKRTGPRCRNSKVGADGTKPGESCPVACGTCA